MSHLGAFREAYPEIALELITSNVFFNLSKREAEVALRPGRAFMDALAQSLRRERPLLEGRAGQP